jgi:hypothetical protein
MTIRAANRVIIKMLLLVRIAGLHSDTGDLVTLIIRDLRMQNIGAAPHIANGVFALQNKKTSPCGDVFFEDKISGVIRDLSNLYESRISLTQYGNGGQACS